VSKLPQDCLDRVDSFPTVEVYAPGSTEASQGRYRRTLHYLRADALSRAQTDRISLRKAAVFPFSAGQKVETQLIVRRSVFPSTQTIDCLR
jgi:hypothetical protein